MAHYVHTCIRCLCLHTKVGKHTFPHILDVHTHAVSPLHGEVCAVGSVYLWSGLQCASVHQICRWSHQIWRAHFPRHPSRPHARTVSPLHTEVSTLSSVIPYVARLTMCTHASDLWIVTWNAVCTLSQGSWMSTQNAQFCPPRTEVCAAPYVARLIMCTRASHL
jgi:hypothetical protein